MKTFRDILFFITLTFCFGCDYLPFQKKKNLITLDTVVDFNSVDTPPTFQSCKDLILKEQQDSCFSYTLAKEFSKIISSQASQEKLMVKSDLDETVNLKIKVGKNGLMQLVEMNLSDTIQNEIPEIESILNNTIQDLPKVFPAIKRGIPVVTEYTLPVRIKL